jgi:DNA-binding beta-propeller fold protein YncE
MPFLSRFRSPQLMAMAACIAVSAASMAVATAALADTGAARNAPLEFKGRALVSISDADMVASAYVDGLLGAREGRDALSVIALRNGDRAIDVRQLKAAEVEVSNSVAGSPRAVSVSPDGRMAFVAESFKQATPAMQRFPELQPGTFVTSVDISNLQAPRVAQRLEVGTRLETVEINPAGDMLAVGLHPRDGRGVAFVPVRGGQMGAPTYTLLPGVDKDTRIAHVSWHPSGNFIAAALCDVGRIVFARVVRQGDTVALQPWGNPMLVGKYPFKVMWAPDGRHVLTNNLQWGPDVVGFWAEAPRGNVVSVRFAEQSTTNAQGATVVPHAIVGTAEVGVSPEGIAISPDGRLVVTTNLERSYLPYADRRITWHSSLSLLTFNPANGQLARVQEFFYDGILPEAAVFDASGRYLAVVNFDHFDDSRTGGSVDFWRVDSDPLNPRPVLVQTTHRVPVARGPHSIVLVP